MQVRIKINLDYLPVIHRMFENMLKKKMVGVTYAVQVFSTDGFLSTMNLISHTRNKLCPHICISGTYIIQFNI